ncbi:hypothetical protein B0F89_101222 [Malaciobacter marinus]|jgi:hypothetical protein|uniref:Uncharacterized protein n=1 Tax=Malaciobacter marinus TaxID=505249 RepID=A0AB37A1C3_9BACT|nr:hypothetical protein B0F89_101222 [Malaciobacter marinus]
MIKAGLSFVAISVMFFIYTSVTMLKECINPNTNIAS